MIEDIIAISSIVLILLVAYLKEQLTKSATLVAFVVGLVLYLCGGLHSLLCLYLFFITSSMATVFNKEYKKKHYSKIYEKNGKRDVHQVLANSLIAVILSIIYYFTKNEIFFVSIVIAFASYNADTWASEFGILSRKENFYLLGFKKVQKGISGAVTSLGLFFSFFGSLIISMIYMIATSKIETTIIIAIFGFISALLDSIFGQLFQVLYYDEKENKYTEKRYSDGIENKKVKGFKIINNDVINFIAPLVTILLYIIIQAFI